MLTAFPLTGTADLLDESIEEQKARAVDEAGKEAERVITDRFRTLRTFRQVCGSNAMLRGCDP